MQIMVGLLADGVQTRSRWGVSIRLLSVLVLLALTLSAPQSPWNPPAAVQAAGVPGYPAPRVASLASGNIGPWTNLFPDLAAISAVSAADAWAVGPGGHLFHFTGGAWVVVNPLVMRGADTADIQMVSPASGWIAAGGRAFQYDGTSWTERSSGLGAGLQVGRIAALAAADVWGIGTTPAAQATLVHWNGSAWQGAGPPLARATTLNAIRMLSAQDGWVVGGDAQGALVLHYDGTRWQAMPAPPTARVLYSVGSAAPGDIWARGMDNAPLPSGHFYHYSNGAWTSTPVASSWNVGPETLVMRSATDGWATSTGSVYHWDGAAWTSETGPTAFVLMGLAALSGQVWAVGSEGTIWSRSGGTWSRQRGKPTENALHAVAAVSAAEAWAVGDSGTILHFANDAWQIVPAPTGANLYAVQMLAADEGWAVGEVILHWDGRQWTQVAAPPTPLFGLALSGSGTGWAVGAGGAIWQATAGTWAPVASPTRTRLNAVALDLATHGWAVGGAYPGSGPVLLEWDGTHWSDQTQQVPYIDEAPTLTAIAVAPGGSAGWAVGDGAGGIRLQNGTWSLDKALPPGDTVALDALDEAWTAGCNISTAYHYAGGAWQAQDLPRGLAPECASGLAVVPGRGGWAVGAYGTLLRYQPLAPGQRFYDVPLTHPFAAYIEYLAARNVVSGYADNTFHPGAPLTRSQLTKMVVAGLSWPLVPPAAPTFADVSASHPFAPVIETAAAHGVISGYTCGGPGEPCDSQHRPYFRPGANVTRAQLAKIIVGAKGWGPWNPPLPPFRDVPPGNPFYGVVEQAAAQGIVSGYGCGGPGAPCPGIYFRPGTSATRGQVSKILALALQQP